MRRADKRLWAAKRRVVHLEVGDPVVVDVLRTAQALRELGEAARRIRAIAQVGAEAGRLLEGEEHVERLGIDEHHVLLPKSIDLGLERGCHPSHDLPVGAHVGGRAIGASLAVRFFPFDDVVVVQVPRRRCRRQQAAFGHGNRQAFGQFRLELLAVEAADLCLHLRRDGFFGELPIGLQEFPACGHDDRRCRHAQSFVARRFQDVRDERRLRALLTEQLALGARSQAVARAGITDPRHDADGDEGQENEGGDQFRLNAQRASVGHRSVGSPASDFCDELPLMAGTPRGPSWDSPRVLARCHGAQRVRALRARGRPSHATREPAVSGDSSGTGHYLQRCLWTTTRYMLPHRRASGRGFWSWRATPSSSLGQRGSALDRRAVPDRRISRGR